MVTDILLPNGLARSAIAKPPISTKNFGKASLDKASLNKEGEQIDRFDTLVSDLWRLDV